MTDVLIVAGIVAVVAFVAWWRKRRDGALRSGRAGERLTPDDRTALGAPADGSLLVEFTAPGCSSCTAAARVLSEVADRRDDVTVVVADVADHVELARTHGILRAPTTLVVGPGGDVHHRVSGVPRPNDVAKVLDAPQRRAA